SGLMSESLTTTFSASSTREVVRCRVCGRSLLLGERSIGYFTVSGNGPFDVCELCVPRAARHGLRPQQFTADEVTRSRRNINIFRRFSRKVRTAAPSTRAKRSATPTMLDGRPLGAVPVGTAAIPLALAAFNQS